MINKIFDYAKPDTNIYRIKCTNTSNNMQNVMTMRSFFFENINQ